MELFRRNAGKMADFCGLTGDGACKADALATELTAQPSLHFNASFFTTNFVGDLCRAGLPCPADFPNFVGSGQSP